MIEVIGLTRRFGARVAVDDISFEVGQGEVVGFLGLNGAGKTTTLRVLAGYLPATSGGARVAGFDVLRDSMEVRRRIGYLPESVPLYVEQRVEQMLMMQARLHGVPRGERVARIGEVLERVGVLDRRRQVIAGLSRGLRQRVGLAVALLPRPEVLILDEPTSGLDPVQRREVRSLLSELAADHTVLLSSHILPEVEAVCARTIIIHAGRIVADGTKEEMVRGMGGGSRTRLEAVVGPDGEGALRSLGSIGGVVEVHDLGRVGIHHVFEIEAVEDLREDVGALAHMKGWAVRELSCKQPSLEQVFARIAVGVAAESGSDEPENGAGAAAPRSSGSASIGGVEGVEATGLGALQMSAAEGPEPVVGGGAADGGAGERQIYSLNPFDGGATRDLGKPTGAGGAEVEPEERCDVDGASEQPEEEGA